MFYKNFNNRLGLLIFISLFIFSSNLIFSQTGKLVGKVVDAKTGEPLIGVNVILKGTTLGAATDINGNYIILRIPPATYNVRASLIGYATVTVNDVEIVVDRTIEQNFTLQDSSVELQQVVVLAEKPKIIKDQTSTSTTLTQEQIKAAPIEGIRGALDLSSGLQKTANGNYSVRGSGSYELNFQINGVEQTNSNTSAPASTPGTEKANNSWKYDVNPLGVSQVQLITGGFSAEYGNAQAGVVKVILKEGTPKISGEARVEYRPPGLYHFGDYIYSKSNIEWQQWGDLQDWFAQKDLVIQSLGLKNKDRYKWLSDKIDNGTATEEEKQQWNQIVNREITWAHDVWVQNHTPSPDNPLGVYDYRKYAYTRYMIGVGGPLGKDPNLLRFYFSGEYRNNPTRLPTPEREQVYQNYILNLTYNPFPKHKFKLLSSFQQYRGGIWSGSDDIRWSGIPFVPAGSSTKYLVTVDPVRTEQTLAQSLDWTYTVNDKSFLETSVIHQSEIFKLPYQYLVSNTQNADKLDSLYDPQVPY